jgi:thiosulfate reductase cytochrome b subunit
MAKTERVYIYTVFERFWHWTQAILVIGLAWTGFMIHFGRDTFEANPAGQSAYVAYRELHQNMAWAFVVLIAFAIFWHFVTGEWKQYLPTRKYLVGMVRFYTVGIFRHEPHPVKKSQISKLNPLQRIAYLGLKILVIPVLVTSGFLYFFYNDIATGGLFANNAMLGTIVAVHTFAAYLLIAFMFGHIYLTTTGHTPTSNIKAMVTGWEEIEVDDDETPVDAATPAPTAT